MHERNVAYSQLYKTFMFSVKLIKLFTDIFPEAIALRTAFLKLLLRAVPEMARFACKSFSGNVNSEHWYNALQIKVVSSSTLNSAKIETGCYT